MGRHGVLIASFALAACATTAATNPSDAGSGFEKDAGGDALDASSSNPVSGTVVNQLGLPAVGTMVQIGSTTATTDSAGHFAINDAPAGSYDVLVVTTTYALPLFTKYIGLSTRTPTLETEEQIESGADLKGSVTPAPVSAASKLAIAFAANDRASYVDSFNPYFSSGGMWDASNVVFFGAGAATRGNVYAIVFDPLPGGLPQQILAYGEDTFVLPSEASATFPPLTVTPSPPQGMITVNVTVPASLSNLAIGACFGVATNGKIDVGGYAPAQTTFATLATPGTTIAVTASAGRPIAGDAGASNSPPYDSVTAFRTHVSPTDNVALTLAEPFGTTAPADGATGIDPSSTMTWTSTPASAYFVEILCFVMNSGVYQGRVVTAGTSAPLVSDASFAIAIPSGAQCDWSVRAFGPAAGVDDLAGAWPPTVRARFWDEMPNGGTSGGTRGATFFTK